MKNLIVSKTLLSCLFILFYVLIPAQILVNKEWTTEIGNPIGEIEWSATVADNAGFTYTTGHNVVSLFEVELFLVKKNGIGQTVWEKAFTLGSGTKSYGIDLVVDNGILYVVGATSNDVSGNHDYLVLQYDTDGNLSWHKVYNSPNNGEDIPTAIAVDATGAIYLTGTSYGSVTDYDYLTLKYSANGILDWDKRYNFNNLKDGAAVIRTLADGNIVVTGGSEAQQEVWDYATVVYEGATGNQLFVKRASSSISGLDAPLGFDIDPAGYFYLTGSGNPNGGTNDVYTVKMDNELNILWQKYYDGEGLDDEGRSVVFGNDGYIYVCGYTSKNNNGADYVLIKYDAIDGAEQWIRQRAAVDPSRICIASHVKKNIDGNLIIAGEEKIGNASVLKMVSYGQNGDLLWELKNEEDALSNEVSTRIVIKGNGEVLVTTHTKESALGQYKLINYKTYAYSPTNDYDTNGIATNVDKEVIIRFNPQVIDTVFADNTNMTFGTVKEIITDQTLIDDMDQLLGTNGSRVEDWVMYKNFPFLTTSDRSFQNKWGEIVPLASIWTSYILLLETEQDENSVAESLSAFSYKDILYATPNIVLEYSSTASSDPPVDKFYSLQGSLFDEVGGINICPAWEQVNGDPSIKIAINDTGISFGHEDFGFGGGFGGLGGSVVQEGYDFTTTGAVLPITDGDLTNNFGYGHGSRVAGIVGALRNNEDGSGSGIGIAGIAGGDILNNDPGARLVILKNGNGDSNLSNARKALAFAALGEPDFSFTPPLVDVINNSYGFNPSQSGAVESLLFDIMIPVYKSGIINVASRGNDEALLPNVPATIRKENMIISVGASGIDGKRKVDANSLLVDDDGIPHTGEQFNSSYGLAMDVLAPGTVGLVTTTNNTSLFPLPAWLFNCVDGDDPDLDLDLNFDYCCFSSTSAAAAHTSGVAALILEHHADQSKLTHEDVERLIEYGATDIDDGGELGYDEGTGWGRLNAGESIDLISANKKVIHFTITPAIEEIQFASYALKWNYGTTLENGGVDGNGIFPGGINSNGSADHLYDGERTKYAANISIDICQMGGTGAQIVDLNQGLDLNKVSAWICNSRSNLWGETGEFTNQGQILVDPIDDVFWETAPVITNCSVTGKLVGYSFTPVTIGSEVIDPVQEIPYPGDNEGYQMVLSVLVEDPNDLLTDDFIDLSDPTSNQNIHSLKNTLKVAPNPAKDLIRIYTENRLMGNTRIRLLDVNGVVVNTFNDMESLNEPIDQELDVSHLNSGVYFIQLINDLEVFTVPFTKIL